MITRKDKKNYTAPFARPKYKKKKNKLYNGEIANKIYKEISNTDVVDEIERNDRKKEI